MKKSGKQSSVADAPVAARPESENDRQCEIILARLADLQTTEKKWQARLAATEDKIRLAEDRLQQCHSEIAQREELLGTLVELLHAAVMVEEPPASPQVPNSGGKPPPKPARSLPGKPKAKRGSGPTAESPERVEDTEQVRRERTKEKEAMLEIALKLYRRKPRKAKAAPPPPPPAEPHPHPPEGTPSVPQPVFNPIALAGGLVLEDLQCPEGLDPKVFHRVLELRAQRLEAEEAIIKWRSYIEQLETRKAGLLRMAQVNSYSIAAVRREHASVLPSLQRLQTQKLQEDQEWQRREGAAAAPGTPERRPRPSIMDSKRTSTAESRVRT